jgi:FkbM family methyltransferase
LQSITELEDFAPDLVKLGVELFGTEDALDQFLQSSRPPMSIAFDGVGMRLKESVGDNSVSRLQGEAGDTYGIDRITETDGVFIDIGMNIGAVTIAVSKKFPGLQVLSAEPIPSTYFLARLNMRLNAVNDVAVGSFGVYPGIPGVLALQRAVASVDKVIPMRYSMASTQDSLVGGQHDEWAKSVNDKTLRPDIGGTWRTTDVHTLVIPTFLEAHQVQQVRFLKMDCEGCEFDAIPHMSKFLSNKGVVQRFAGEIHRVKVEGAMDMSTTKNFDKVLTARGCMPNAAECYQTQC